MSVWLYFPFSNYEQDDVLKKDVTDLRSAGVNFHRTGNKPGCLQRVGDEDLLMIAGHGDEGDFSISMTGRKGERSLTANDLAQKLKTYGLKRTHQSILLLTCFGGGSTTKHTGVPRVVGIAKSESVSVHKKSAGKCLAAVLAKSLGKAGYYSILVGGWPGEFVSNDPETGTPSFESNPDGKGTQNTHVAQLDHIQWYDATGANTA